MRKSLIFCLIYWYPAWTRRKIAHFLSNLLRSGLNSKENRPFSVRSVEIRPELEESGKIMSRSGQVSLDPTAFGKIRQIFAQLETDQLDQSAPGKNPTTRTDSVHQSTVGLSMRNPKWSGRFRVGHKPNLNQHVDSLSQSVTMKPCKMKIQASGS